MESETDGYASQGSGLGLQISKFEETVKFFSEVLILSIMVLTGEMGGSLSD